MKPTIIDNLGSFDVPESLRDINYWQGCLNEPQVAAVPDDDKRYAGFDLMVKTLHQYGYNQRRTSFCYNKHLLGVQESVGVHTDEDFGLTAACVVHLQSKNFYLDPQLVTKHGGLSVRLYDLFIFDSDKWHAWISHDFCLLACVSVSRRRSRRNIEIPAGRPAVNHPTT